MQAHLFGTTGNVHGLQVLLEMVYTDCQLLFSCFCYNTGRT